MLKVVAGVQTTAGHERVGGTDSCRIAERHTYVIIIILFQEGIGKDAEDVTAVVVPVFGYKLRSNLLKLIGKTVLAGDIVALFQGCCNCISMFVSIFPQKRAAGIFPTARVCNIENIFEPWIIAAGIDQCDTSGTTTDITPHLLIPKVIASASGSIRFLSVDHQLLMKRILVQATGSFEERCPFTKAAGYLLGCVIGHLSVEIQFTRHQHPPHRNR
ncbi:MAG: hypothetical protein IKC03_04060, partial [Oscillospiraceae bacterium]|nr:hypothetical protein [Oscillospiraceae bacterium]